MLDRDHTTVNLSANALIANIGVDDVCKSSAVAPLGSIFTSPLGVNTKFPLKTDRL